MNHQPDDLERRRLQQRLVELRNQIHEISGGAAEFGPAGDGLSLEDEVAFLENIVAFETAPRTTWLERLRSAGYAMPDPASLSDAEIGLEVWQAIQRLSELQAFLSHTNHFSDRELYEHLYHHTLPQETLDVAPNPDAACHLDLVGSGSDEDITCWLRYYADEKEREEWQAEFPDFVMPPAEKPPHDRDRLLPQREFPQDENEFWKFLEGLLTADWDAADGPIQLATDLAQADVAGVRSYVAARALLETLRDCGPVKATAKLGNLPRSLVNQVFPLLPYDDEERRLCLEYNKVFNEEDLQILHAARLTCQTAKLLRKTKGRFAITRKGTALLDPARSGELYRVLFITYFRSINLSYFDAMLALDEIQQTLAVILWRLGIVARDWTPVADLTSETLLPDVLDAVAQYEDRPYSAPGSTLNCRLWRHLDDFGLLEPGQESSYGLPDACRITPLFYRFLTFEGG